MMGEAINTTKFDEIHLLDWPVVTYNNMKQDYSMSDSDPRRRDYCPWCRGYGQYYHVEPDLCYGCRGTGLVSPLQQQFLFQRLYAKIDLKVYPDWPRLVDTQQPVHTINPGQWNEFDLIMSVRARIEEIKWDERRRRNKPDQKSRIRFPPQSVVEVMKQHKIPRSLFPAKPESDPKAATFVPPSEAPEFISKQCKVFTREEVKRFNVKVHQCKLKPKNEKKSKVLDGSNGSGNSGEQNDEHEVEYESLAQPENPSDSSEGSGNKILEKKRMPEHDTGAAESMAEAVAHFSLQGDIIEASENSSPDMIENTLEIYKKKTEKKCLNKSIQSKVCKKESTSEKNPVVAENPPEKNITEDTPARHLLKKPQDFAETTAKPSNDSGKIYRRGGIPPNMFMRNPLRLVRSEQKSILDSLDGFGDSCEQNNEREVEVEYESPAQPENPSDSFEDSGNEILEKKSMVNTEAKPENLNQEPEEVNKTEIKSETSEENEVKLEETGIAILDKTDENTVSLDKDEKNSGTPLEEKMDHFNKEIPAKFYEDDMTANSNKQSLENFNEDLKTPELKFEKALEKLVHEGSLANFKVLFESTPVVSDDDVEKPQAPGDETLQDEKMHDFSTPSTQDENMSGYDTPTNTDQYSPIDTRNSKEESIKEEIKNIIIKKTKINVSLKADRRIRNQYAEKLKSPNMSRKELLEMEGKLMECQLRIVKFETELDLLAETLEKLTASLEPVEVVQLKGCKIDQEKISSKWLEFRQTRTIHVKVTENSDEWEVTKMHMKLEGSSGMPERKLLTQEELNLGDILTQDRVFLTINSDARPNAKRIVKIIPAS